MVEARRVRPGSDPQLFWIDAICVNQDDIQECTEQVKGMRGLYEAATCVRIWLGDKLVAPDGSALQLPEMLTSRADQLLGRVRLAELGHMPVVLAFFVQALRNSHLAEETKPEDSSDTPEIGYPLLKSPEYLILAAFFKQPWFDRVWVVQEAVMARESNITVGDLELDWEPFSKAVHNLHASAICRPYSMRLRMIGRLSEVTLPGIATSPALFICNIQRLASSAKHLFTLLINSRTRKATKPVDHVFGLLGMAEEMVDDALTSNIRTLRVELLAVDYAKPVSQVFMETTWFIILSHKTLVPLTLAELTDDNANLNCPSWVPVWSQRRKTTPLYAEIFNAAFGQKIKLSSIGTLDTLCVSGYRFEPVKVVTDELPTVPGDDVENTVLDYPPRQEEIDYVGSAWALVTSCLSNRDSDLSATMSQGTFLPPYQTDEQILDAFIYTLYGNWNEDSHNERADGSTDIVDSAQQWLEKHVDRFTHSKSLVTKIRNIIVGTFNSNGDLAFHACLLRACLGRKFFITNSGFIGIGRSGMKSGDLIAVILGIGVPLVLREVDGRESPRYLLVGECYVQGIMDGELVQRRLNSRTEAEIFRLI
jgi:hypothetical protein